MLRLTSFSLSTTSAVLLDSVDAVLAEGELVGLVGANGSGKSTLLHAVASQIQQRMAMLSSSEEGGNDSDENDAYWAITSGRMEGSLLLSPPPSSPSSVLHVHQDVLSWSSLFPGIGDEEELREMPLSDVLDLGIMEGDYSQTEEEETWRKLCIVGEQYLGWKSSNYSKTPLGLLSPGSALRAYLAIALHRPSVQLLLLDEPTNHLDLPSILWLQHSLLASKKTVILVSHDEAFLDAVVNRIWEIGDDGSLTVSLSQYSAYKHAKLLAIEQQRKAYDEQRKRHARLTAAISKLKVATKRGEFYVAPDHDTLQRDFKRDRAGRSGKKAAALTHFRDSEEKVEKVIDHVPLRLRLTPLPAGSDSSILVDSLKLGYSSTASSDTAEGDSLVSLPLPPLSLRIDFGERVAIIGFNGVGKSTLLRTLQGILPPLSGSVTIGKDLRIGNLMQAHESLPRDQTPREFIASLTSLDLFHSGTRVISYGLTLHQVDSPISELNPGARARLLLASFSILSVNVLILDEPTNHLDPEAVHELTSSLNTFNGTILVVSHDRELLSSLSLTRRYSLTADSGLKEEESIESFVEEIEEVVERVVGESFRY